MKILIFTETYLPTVNGVVNSIELFRHELEKRGHQVYIVAPHSVAEDFKAREHVFRLPSIPLLGQPSHPIAWPYLSHVKAIVAEVKPDIIHCQGMFLTSLLGKKAAAAANIPHLLTYHTHLEGYAHYAGPLAPIAKPFLNLWTKIFARGFDVVITPTPSMAKLLKSYGITTDIVALPTGIELKDYKTDDKKTLRKKLNLDPDAVYIIYAGRLAAEKNVMKLFDDFGRLHVRDKNVRLLLAGDGPDYKAYQAIIATRGLEDVVHFLGVVRHPELADYFAACDIFAFPSLTDTQGIVLIEAFACGLPAVVYDALGPGDIVKNEENGLKASVSSDQFFHWLWMLVQDKHLREKLSIGALRDVRKYSIEKTTDQLEQLYQVLTKS